MSTELTDQAREVAEAMAPVLARDYRKECWITAYAAVLQVPNVSYEDCARFADAALEGFNKRFPS